MIVLTGEQPFQPAVCLAAETNGCTPGGGGLLYWAPEHSDFPRAVPNQMPGFSCNALFFCGIFADSVCI